MKKHETMFAEIRRIHNENVGNSISADVFLSILFEKGFITKNKDGSYYRTSFNIYLSLLKKNDFMDFEFYKQLITVKKEIPADVSPKSLKDRLKQP